MKSIGIDAVDIDRFKHWHLYKQKQLLKIFTEQEIAYCLENPAKSAERFAARFAAKEACYKAISQLTKKPLSFIATARLFEVKKTVSGTPTLSINWLAIASLSNLKSSPIMLSLTHTKNTTIAVVVLL
jgi:holo-[acyl-carrier protein] synthase